MIQYKISGFRYLLLLVLGSLFPMHFLYAQTGKELDKIINSAMNVVFSNPDMVIRIGENIVNKSGNNVDVKIRGYILISDAYSVKRDYLKSQDYTNKAIQLLTLTKNIKLKINILNKIGIQYQQLKFYEKAIYNLDEAEQLIKGYAHKDSVSLPLGVNYIVKGIIYKEKRANEMAIDFFDRGIAEMLKLQRKSVYGMISIAKYNKGNCYIILEKNDLAIQNFDEAFKYAKEIKAKSLQAFALKGKAEVCANIQENKEAIYALHSALDFAFGSNDLILFREIYKGLSENYLAINNIAEHKKYYMDYLQVRNEINLRERNAVSNLIYEKRKEIKIDFEKKVKEFYWLYSGLLLLFVLTVVILQVQAQKRVKKIDQKKKEIQLMLSQKKTD